MTFPVGFNSRLDDVVASTDELRAVPTAASVFGVQGLGVWGFPDIGVQGLGFRGEGSFIIPDLLQDCKRVVRPYTMSALSFKLLRDSSSHELPRESNTP